MLSRVSVLLLVQTVLYCQYLDYWHSTIGSVLEVENARCGWSLPCWSVFVYLWQLTLSAFIACTAARRQPQLRHSLTTSCQHIRGVILPTGVVYCSFTAILWQHNNAYPLARVEVVVQLCCVNWPGSSFWLPIPRWMCLVISLLGNVGLKKQQQNWWLCGGLG